MVSERGIAFAAVLAALLVLAPVGAAEQGVSRPGLHAHATALPEVPPLLRAPSHAAGHGAGSFPRTLPGSQVGGALLFEANTPASDCIWRTDGTFAGTFPIADCLYFKGSRFVLPVGPRKVLPAPDGRGLQLWATDGTAGGTLPLTAFDDLTSLWLDVALTPDRDGMIFPAFDAANGFEPWITDGTPGGTGRFADARPGPDSSWPSGFSFLEDGRMLFFVNDLTGPPYDVFSSDLTAAGTAFAFELDVPEFAAVSRFSAAPEAALFWVSDIVGPNFFCALELRRTDGTAAGTYKLADFELPGCLSFGTTPVRFGDHRYFDADDGVHGSEVWRSDGTTLERLTDAPGAGPLSADPLQLVPLASGVVLPLDGGQGRELWRLDDDGAPVDAPLVDLCPGGCAGLPGDHERLTPIGGGVVFRGDDGVSGEEVWFSDGTAEGTKRLADLCPGACSSSPSPIYAFDGYVLTFADDGSHGRQLWRVNVPSGFAIRLTDVPPAAQPYSEAGWPLGRCLIFPGDDGEHGREPWVSDGSRLGTRMIADLRPDGDGRPGLRVSIPRRPGICDSPRFKRSWWCPCVTDGPAPLAVASPAAPAF